MNFDTAIVAANAALAEQGCGLRVERRGTKTQSAWTAADAVRNPTNGKPSA